MNKTFRRFSLPFRQEFRGAATVAVMAASALAAVSFSNRIHAVTGLFGSLHPHLCAALFIGAFALALLGAPLRSGLALFVALICTGQVMATIRDGRDTSPATGRAAFLRIESFNILSENAAGGPAIADYVANSGADIFVVMEARPLFPHMEKLWSLFPYHVGCDTSLKCDLTIFSRVPVVDPHVMTAGPLSPDRVASMTVMKDGVSVHLVAAHLTKPYFDDHGYDELEWLRHQVETDTGPVIVAGDFNQASWSPMMSRFLRVTGLRTADFEPATWPSDWGPWGIPIDHILTKGGLSISSVAAIDDPMGSNHRGLSAELSLSR
jgi:endonuclease/exonuclease/phosphatase (EEP) superfamily protein YafD